MKWSNIFVFSDLDDTLIQTAGKLPDGVKSEVAAYDRNGDSLSYFSSHQKVLLNLFARAGATIIPVTGRTKEALERVNYLFKSYSAVSHGAAVLKPDSSVCEYWLELIRQEKKDWPQALERVNELMQRSIRKSNLDAQTRVIIDQGIHAYVSVKGTKGALDALESIGRDTSLRLHRNGRNLALLPAYTSKKRAVEHIKNLLEIKPDDLVLGMGDSLTDLPFMRLCQFGIFPAGSQIDQGLSSE